MSNTFISLINETFTDRKRSILDLTQGQTHIDLLRHEDFNQYFLANLLKKAEGLNLGIDPDEVAITNFKLFLREQEEKVVRVGALLDNIDRAPVLKRILDHVKRLMAKFFKPWSVVALKPRFTLGSTLTLEKGDSVFDRVKASEGHKVLKSNFHKLYDVDGCTAYTDSLLYKLPHTEGTESWFVDIITVPKGWDESRIVGLGPSAALAHQCGFADWLTERLLTFCGIDLSTAPAVHKVLAMENSLGGDWSTQDQRKASDNILSILAQFVLPVHVFEYMRAVTPSVLQVDGLMVNTHMLCPAGNGFNTPFQTLLFWTLIKGIQMELGVKHKVYVYGDDVICHNSVYDSVIKVFPLLGLEINPKKSFKDGPFRESCGGDFLYGLNIRSYYAKGIPRSTLDWIKFTNGVRRVGYYNSNRVWRTRELRNLWFRSLLRIPKTQRLFCPLHYGDAGINTENERLYKFGPAQRSYQTATGRDKYPNYGYDRHGNPFSAERIKIYVPQIGGSRTTFGKESQGLDTRNVLRLLTSPSVLGSGQRLRKKPDVHGDLWFYPKAFGGAYEKHVQDFVPYTLFGAPPQDIEELFAFLKERGKAPHLTDRKATLKRLYVKELTAILQRRVDEMNRLEQLAAITSDVLSVANNLNLS